VKKSTTTSNLDSDSKNEKGKKVTIKARLFPMLNLTPEDVRRGVREGLPLEDVSHEKKKK